MKKVILIFVMIMTLISNSILVSASSYYQVVGDSMNPILNEGDTIQIVSEYYEDGDMVVAQLKDGRKIVKRLMGDRIVSVGHGTSYPVSEVTILGAAEYVPMSMEELERYGFSWESVLAEGETITQIAAGWAHSLALTNTGVVYAWGAGGYGRLGNGANTQQTTPVKVLDGAIEGGNSGVTAISAGENFSLALKGGVVYAWGANFSGQLGNGNNDHQNTPIKVSAGDMTTNEGVTAISAGGNHSLAIKDGEVYAWGYNSAGQLGNGERFNQNIPIKVSDGAMNNSGVTAVSAGQDHSLAIKGEEVYAWGDGSWGQLGNGAYTEFQTTPVKVSDGGIVGGNSGVTAISAGGVHSLAIKEGVVYAWGRGTNGQLGNGSTSDQSTPVLVSDGGIEGGNSGVTAISAGGSHSLALKGGKAYAWGSGEFGRLGNGANIQQDNPVEVSPGEIEGGNLGVTAISAGGQYSLALKGGEVYAWGTGANGRLGNGAVDNHNTPVATNKSWIPIDTPINIVAIPGVTAPVRTATPVTTITETAQYTGTVTWSPADNPFGASTVYTATITLTPKAGFTLTGVAENLFTVAGATATNAANTGVVTAVFPATGAPTPGTLVGNMAAGSYIDFGGRTWRLADSSTRYLVMTTNYETSQWSTMNNIDASAVFNYLGANFDEIITVVEHRDLIQTTDWDIRGVAWANKDLITPPLTESTMGGTISPLSFNQKLGILSTGEWNTYKNHIGNSDRWAWTRSPVTNYTNLAYVVSSDNGSVNMYNISHGYGVRPALYLKPGIVFPGGDGTQEAPYTLIAPLSSNADLSNIILSSGTLSPTFASGTTSYTANVGNEITNIAVTPTIADSTATVKVNNSEVTSGNQSGAINLNVGTNTITIVVTAQDTTTKTYTITVTRAAAPPSGGGGGGGGSSTPTPTPSEQKSEPVIVIVNNKEVDAGKRTESEEDGKTTSIIQVNNIVIESKIEEAIQNNPTGVGNKIQVPVIGTNSQQIKVELTGDIVKKLENNNFIISIKRDSVDYVIPAKEFTISSIAERLGVKEESLQVIKVEVRINKLDERIIETYNEVAKRNNAVIIFPPVEFEIVAKTTKTDGTTQEQSISRFSNYVERVLEIPAGTDPSKITTGVVFNSDGTYSHVPSLVYQKDSKWYASINSLTNSTYSVIWNPVTVKSVANHWSKYAVNDMASRLIIFNTETFAPNKAITRADFAEYIIRALGLYREGSTHTNKFSDVKEEGDRTLAILIASEYGIVSGYPDGTFRPDALITREEAMTMYQRAMKVTKLVGTDINRYQSYTDYKQVSNWASPYVKEVLSAHVFNGNTATTISPKTNLTYAEAAQAIKNLLVESKLINK
ncbi:MAG: S-layer homology domain-containing protein [Clostridiales bacterium]